MPDYKYILKSFLYFIISMIIILVLTSTLNYFNLINYSTVYIISFIVLILSSLYSGYYIARHSYQKGYLMGSLTGAINVLFLIVLSLIFSKLSLISLLYYLILLLSSITGGIFGINHKKNK